MIILIEPRDLNILPKGPPLLYIVMRKVIYYFPKHLFKMQTKSKTEFRLLFQMVLHVYRFKSVFYFKICFRFYNFSKIPESLMSPLIFPWVIIVCSIVAIKLKKTLFRFEPNSKIRRNIRIKVRFEGWNISNNESFINPILLDWVGINSQKCPKII